MNSQTTLFNILLDINEVLNNFCTVFYGEKRHMLGLSGKLCEKVVKAVDKVTKMV